MEAWERTRTKRREKIAKPIGVVSAYRDLRRVNMFLETEFDVHIRTTTTMFGSCPNDPSIYQAYLQDGIKDGIDSDTPEARAEIAALPYTAEREAAEDKAQADHTTVFLRIDDCPGLHGHVMKGFFKSACGALWAIKDTHSVKLRAYKKRIDTLIHIQPQILKLTSSTKPIDHLTTYLDRKTGQLVCVRPLRAQTAQGPRVALARSEVLPPGTELGFRLIVIGSVPELGREATKKEPIHEELLHEWLSFGKWHGLGSWRNAGWGRFTYSMERVAA